MSTWPLLRGQVVQANIALDEPKLFVVVSNNRRNERLPNVLAVRLTTSAKPEIPAIVRLPEGEIFVGCAVCDDIIELYEDEILKICGGLTPNTLQEIGDGLRAALALD